MKRVLAKILTSCAGFPAMAVANGSAELTSGPGFAQLAKMMGSLAIILCLIYFVSIVLRQLRFGPNNNTDTLKVVTTLSLSPKERVLVVQIGEEQILLGSSSAGLQTLHTLQAPIAVRPASDKKSNFTSILRSLQGRVGNA